jgi:leucine dehydrogenase
MDYNLQSLIQQWDGLGVVCRYDQPTHTWVFICLHDNTLGPCTGGTRMKVYSEPGEGLRDAMRLAEGMTSKWAAIDVAAGGGKAVLAIERPLAGAERNGLLFRYGKLIQSLGGGFRTGEDMGTGTEDMQVIAEEADYVHGFDPEDGSKVDPSPYTARAVFAGIRSAVSEVFEGGSLEGRKVLIQGVGSVGASLGEFLKEAGAKLLVSDIDELRCQRVADLLDATVLPNSEVYATGCDVYAPCAVGATLNRESIPRLQCRIVAGSANNQLEEPADADRLLERDIVYIPDYIINAGGALSFSLLDNGLSDRQALLQKMDVIGESVAEILREAGAKAESPIVAAQRRVDRALAKARNET